MKQRILAVDDEPDLLRLTERIITQKTPYQITSTYNSLEVPKLLEENQYDLILVDLKMPGLDGMEILRMVKDQNRHELVIMITAFGSLESAVEAMSLGVFDYVTKPFKKEQIIFTVEKAMRYQRTIRESNALKEIFQSEPYEKAREKFLKEYIKLLNDKYKNDIQQMSSVSGLSESIIKENID